MRMQPKHVAPDLAEAVDIALARRAPVDELDAQLERRLGLADHFQRVDAGEREVVADVRDRRLADPDGPNLFRLDQGDLDLAKPLRQYGGCHPAGGPPADDSHSAYWLIAAHMSLASSAR